MTDIQILPAQLQEKLALLSFADRQDILDALAGWPWATEQYKGRSSSGVEDVPKSLWAIGDDAERPKADEFSRLTDALVTAMGAVVAITWPSLSDHRKSSLARNTSRAARHLVRVGESWAFLGDQAAERIAQVAALHEDLIARIEVMGSATTGGMLRTNLRCVLAERERHAADDSMSQDSRPAACALAAGPV